MELAFKMYRLYFVVLGKRYWRLSTCLQLPCTVVPRFFTTVSKEVPVKVSNNGQEWTQSSLTFQYIPLLHLVSVKPSHGLFEGQTVLKILVSGMSRLDLNDLSCQLGIRLCLQRSLI